MEDVYAMFQVNLVGLVAPDARRAARDGRARPRQDREQRQHQRLRVVPRRHAPTRRPRPGVVAFCEALRRELDGHRGRRAAPGDARRGHGHARRHARGLRPAHVGRRLGRRAAGASGRRRSYEAIENDDHVLGPGGRLALAKLASRGPAAADGRDLEARILPRAPVGGLRQLELGHGDAALAEAALAVARSRAPTGAGSARRSPARPAGPTRPGSSRASARSVCG